MKTSEIVLSVVLVLFIILIIKQENPDLKLSFNSLNEMIYGVKTYKEQAEAYEDIPDSEEPLEESVDDIPVVPEEPDGYLRIPATYEANSVSKHSEIDFTVTTENNMSRKNTAIPVVPPHKIDTFPCRTTAHSWDSYGVHKIEEPTEKCRGGESAFPGRPVEQFFHPSNYALNSQYTLE